MMEWTVPFWVWAIQFISWLVMFVLWWWMRHLWIQDRQRPDRIDDMIEHYIKHGFSEPYSEDDR